MERKEIIEITWKTPESFTDDDWEQFIKIVKKGNSTIADMFKKLVYMYIVKQLKDFKSHGFSCQSVNIGNNGIDKIWNISADKEYIDALCSKYNTFGKIELIGLEWEKSWMSDIVITHHGAFRVTFPDGTYDEWGCVRLSKMLSVYHGTAKIYDKGLRDEYNTAMREINEEFCAFKEDIEKHLKSYVDIFYTKSVESVKEFLIETRQNAEFQFDNDGVLNAKIWKY